MKLFHTEPVAIPRIASRVETLLIVAALVENAGEATISGASQTSAVLAAAATKSRDLDGTIVLSNMKAINQPTNCQHSAYKIQGAQRAALLRKEFKRHTYYQISRS
ncbi:hypothetical protein [Candidatus Vallotia lariciata]|uniref:hypothetical protein n=1 Tax=Candidatus Vallotia laricis TaxID=2018052 RepID=UPI001D011742|nr:hypothetical protein [Candidatus Vallotia lariciata]UDG83147.1 hypothetical protein GKR41_00533 [Candidatus Vallotia lariciata]